MAEKKIESIWDLDDYKPFQAAFDARRDVLLRRERYYKGTAYQSVSVAVGGSDPLKALYASMVSVKTARVNASIKALIDPVATAVDLDVGLVPGNWELAPESMKHQTAVDALFNDVNFIEEGDLYTLYGASMGVATFLIVDDRVNKRVDIQAIHPSTVLPVYGPGRSTSRAISMAIIVEQVDGHEEATVMTTNQIRTYRDGQPVVLYGNLSEYPNLLGFVPIVDQPYQATGEDIGKCAFYDVINQLDAVNATATQLTENIRKNANPQWVVMSDDDLPDAPIQRSDDKLWKISAQGGVEAIVAALDIEGVNATIDSIYEKLEKKLPQFLLHKLVGMNRVSAETIRIQLMPLVIHIEAVRRSLDAGVVRALRMAGRVAQLMELDASLQALDDPALKLNKERRVIPLDAMTLLALEEKQLQVEVQKEVLAAQRALNGGEGGAAPAGPVADDAKPENIEADGLNGAQIKAAVELLQGVSAGTVASQVALELLISLGIERERAMRMVKEAEGINLDAGEL